MVRAGCHDHAYTTHPYTFEQGPTSATSDALPSNDWDDIKEREVIRKINRQVLLKFCVLTVLNYLDRTNLAFAAPRMNKDLHFTGAYDSLPSTPPSHHGTESIYAKGASIFFVGYALFQVPSNLVLLRLGGRVWLSIMLIAWGLAATAFAGMQQPVEFYVLRFLLGLAECGTFPGMWFHLSLFYDSAHMGVAYGTIVAAVVLSQVLGGPIAACTTTGVRRQQAVHQPRRPVLLSMDGVLGIAGWRWLFIMEGVPTVLFGVYLYRTLADGPGSDGLLTLEEQGWLLQRCVDLWTLLCGGDRQHLRLARDKEGGGQQARTSWDGAGNWRTWYCAVISFQNAIAKYDACYQWWMSTTMSHYVGMPSCIGRRSSSTSSSARLWPKTTATGWLPCSRASRLAWLPRQPWWWASTAKRRGSCRSTCGSPWWSLGRRCSACPWC